MGGMPLSEAAVKDLIRPSGESATVEYKRSPPDARDLAKSLVAEGHVFVVEALLGTDKPYARVHEGHRTCFVRVGTTTREAGTEELQRPFMSGGRFHADEMPVPGTSPEDLEGPALYTFARTAHRKDRAALHPARRRAWLTHVGYLHSPDGPATLAGVLLFAEVPEEHVPENGVVTGRFAGADVASGLEDRQEVGGRLPVLVDNALRAVQATLGSRTRPEEERLVSEPEIPSHLLREALVNAIVHRDYTLRGRKARVLIFADHLEVRSPGSPPNMVTVERIVAGRMSIPRNPLLFNAMAHLNYVQNFGMGVKTIVEESARLGRPALVAFDVDETVVGFPRGT